MCQPLSCPLNYLWIFICDLSRYTDFKCSLSHTLILTSPNPESQVVTLRMHFSIYAFITYNNAAVHASQPVPSQLIQLTIPTTTQSIPCLCYPNQTQKELSDNATFQIAWFWHWTESQYLKQLLPQRKGRGLPLHRAQDDVMSKEGGTFHTETQQGSGTEGQIVQQPHQMMKKAGDMQAEELLCCSFFVQTLLFFFSPSSASVLQLVTDCHTFSSTLLSPTMSLLLLLLSSTAVISTHSQLSSLCSAKALPGNNIFAAAFTAFSWLLCVTPLPCVLLLQSVWMPLGEGPPGAVFSQSLSNMAPLLPNFILANILINVTKCSSTVMSSRRDWWNNCVAGMKQPGWWRSKASMSCASLT